MIRLSKEQDDIIESAIRNFKIDHKSTFITGPAGTGKTTIADRLAEILFNEGMKVYFAAPTHTASNRLQKILSDGNRSIDVSTVHKFLGMKHVGTSYGKLIFEMTADSRKPLEDDEILIVDEASMLSEELYNNIISVCRHRVIFLGDSCQIPSVTEDDDSRTRILSIKDSEPPVKRRVKNVVELTHVYRQRADTALLELCTAIRNSILNGTSHKLYDDNKRLLEKIYELSEKGDDTIYVDIPGSEVVSSLIHIPDTCFLGFGNPTIDAVQKHLPEWYIAGGSCISNGPAFKVIERDNGKSKFSMIFPNNTHLVIKEIKKNNIRKWGVWFDQVIDDEGRDFFCPANADKFLDIYARWIQIAKYNGNIGQIDADMMSKYQEFEYASLTNKNLNDFMALVTTLREGRVSTIHRAQGQQWENCIIAYNNIRFAGVNMDKENRNKDIHRKIIAMKLLYTAISRAKEKVIFCFENKKEAYTPAT